MDEIPVFKLMATVSVVEVPFNILTFENFTTFDDTPVHSINFICVKAYGVTSTSSHSKVPPAT
jgi:hypothetical protein